MIQKSMAADPAGSGAGIPNELELGQINRLTNRPLTAEEVYSFTVILCDNEVDRDLERFSIPALRRLAGLFPGRSGIFDHSMSGRDQVARLYDCWVEQEEGRKTRCGEVYTMLKGKGYMLRDSAVAREIEAGIKREVSVSCSVARTVCSICGADRTAGTCPHEAGRTYNGALCCGVLEEPVDAYEWSFVAVPAQRAAGVTKAFRIKGGDPMMEIMGEIESAQGEMTLSAEQVRELSKGLRRLRSLARDGEQYRRDLCGQIRTLCGAAAPWTQPERLNAVLDRLTAEELGEVRKLFAGRADQQYPPAPQFGANAGKEDRGSAENSAFKMGKGAVNS